MNAHLIAMIDKDLDRVASSLSTVAGVAPGAAHVLLAQRALAALHGMAPGSAARLVGAANGMLEVTGGKDPAAEGEIAERYDQALDRFLEECAGAHAVARDV